jgi:hypothetical protein
MKNAEKAAFPLDKALNDVCGSTTNPCGLTKREYFAGLAMQSILPFYASRNGFGQKGLDWESKDGEPDAIADYAILMADALLSRLEQPDRIQSPSNNIG